MKKLLLAALLVPVMALAQTFPSPTFNSLTLQNPLAVASGGTGIASLGTGVAAALGTAVTGSGGFALSTSPTLTSPNLGTPSAATLTNATGLPVATGISGLGTGVAAALANAATGTGSLVLATSPSISAPTVTGATTFNGTYAGSMSIPSTSLTYTQPGTGGGSQTISGKFSRIIDVNDFSGVDKTGSTDSTSGINNAISVAEAAHARLYFPAGTYKVTSSLSTITSSMELAGDGMGNSVIEITTSQSTPVVHITSAGSNYSYVHDLTIKSTVTTASGCDGLRVDGGNAFNISRVEVSGTYNGINIPASQGGAFMLDNWVHNITNNGYMVDAGNMLVRGNFSINCGTYGFYFTAISGNSAGLMVLDNTAFNNTSGNFVFLGNTTYNIIDLVVANDVASTATNGNGFYFNTYGKFINVSNVFTELAGANSSGTYVSNQDGVYVTPNNSNVTFSNVVSIGSGAAGMHIDCNDFSVTGGMYVANATGGGASQAGIVVGVAGAVTGWTITGINTRPGSGVSDSQPYGVNSYSSGNTGLLTSSILHGTTAGSVNTGSTATFANNVTY